MTDNDSPQPRPRRISVLAVLSVLAFAVAILLTISNIDSGSSQSGKALVSADLFAWAAAAILGIVALIAIARSGGRLRGRFGAGFAVVASSLALGMYSLGMGGKHVVYTMDCQQHLKGLANALLVYAQDNDESLPDADHWCDLLIAKADISPTSLVCWSSYALRGESSYSMNAAIAGRKLSELPPDMVVLFDASFDKDEPRDMKASERAFVSALDLDTGYWETRKVRASQWNQVGGLKTVNTTNHHGGCNVLFGDMRVKFIRAKALPSLRWSIEVDPPPSPLRSSIGGYELRVAIPAAMACAAFIFTIIVLVRYRQRGSIAMGILMALGAAGVGFLGGAFSEIHHAVAAGSIGAMAGTVFGFLAGLSYGTYVRTSSGSITSKADVQHYAVAVGMAAGAVVSTLVHVTLSLFYEDFQGGLPIVAGLPFGIVAGAVLGGIACAFIPVADKPIAETAHD